MFELKDTCFWRCQTDKELRLDNKKYYSFIFELVISLQTKYRNRVIFVWFHNLVYVWKISSRSFGVVTCQKSVFFDTPPNFHLNKIFDYLVLRFNWNVWTRDNHIKKFVMIRWEQLTICWERLQTIQRLIFGHKLNRLNVAFRHWMPPRRS